MERMVSEKLLGQLLCGIGLVEVLLDDSGEVSDTHLYYVNPALTKILNLSREELLILRQGFVKRSDKMEKHIL